MNRKTKLLLGGGVLALFFFGFVASPLPSLIGKGSILGKDVSMDSSALSVAGAQVQDGAQVSVGGTFLLDNIMTRMVQKYSESETAANGGHIEVFRKDVNPKSSTATALATLSLGTAYTTVNIRCDEEYRVVYNNGTEGYSQDLGKIVLVPCSDTTPELADANIDFTEKFGIKAEDIATLSDILDETDVVNKPVNGQDNTSQNLTLRGVTNANEFQCVVSTQAGCDADGILVYNESTGDGSVYLDLTLAASGSNAELKEPVLCYRHDLTNTPEGNELSSVSVALRTGSDLGFGSPNWATLFQNEECAKSSVTHMQAGTSSTYRMTLNFVEANLDDHADVFNIVFDDLGGDRATDIRNNRGATADTVAIESSS